MTGLKRSRPDKIVDHDLQINFEQQEMLIFLTKDLGFMPPLTDVDVHIHAFSCLTMTTSCLHANWFRSSVTLFP